MKRTKSSKKDTLPHSMSLWNFLKDFAHLSDKDKQKKISVYHYSLRRAKKLTKENGIALEQNFHAVVDEQKNDPKSMYYHGLNEWQRQYIAARRHEASLNYYHDQLHGMQQRGFYDASNSLWFSSYPSYAVPSVHISQSREQLVELPGSGSIVAPPPGLSHIPESNETS